MHIFNLGFVDVALFLHMALGKHSTSDSHDVFNAGKKRGPGKNLVRTKSFITKHNFIRNAIKSKLNKLKIY